MVRVKQLIESRPVDQIIFSILEGVYDPGILKAAFLAGGPGSGKSFVTGDLFGIPSKLKQASFSAFGLKLVNSDRAFEKMLNDSGLGTDLAAMSDSEFARAMEIRGEAKKVTQAMQKNFIDGRLGMIIDQTSRRVDKVAGQKAQLEALGYDTMMVFVNTTLDVALERNRQRDRKLDDDLVVEIWNEAQALRPRLAQMFGNNFVLVDNSEYKEIGRAVSAFDDKINSVIRRFVTAPIRNQIGRLWVERALEAKRLEGQSR